MQFLRMYWAPMAGVLAFLTVVVAGWMWWMMQQPMYTPGDVRAATKLGAPLVPPPQSVGGDWLMEPGIALHHFASGTGPNVLVLHGGPGVPSTAAWPGLERLAGSYRFHYFDQRGCGASSHPFDRFASQIGRAHV